MSADSDRSTPEDLIARVTQANLRGVSCADLDEAVHELAHPAVADAYNSTAMPDLDEEDAYDRLHDLAGQNASATNNGGLQTQLAFILQQCGPSGALALLETVGHPDPAK